MKKFAIGSIMAVIIAITGNAHAASVNWSQRPSMNPANGYAFSSETQVPSQVADDFRYENGGPVTAITWWGSYWDTTIGAGNYYPYRNSAVWGDPDVGTPEIITGFNISFYEDVPGGTALPPWSHPGVPALPTYTMTLANVDVQTYGVIDRGYSTQTVFRYDVVLDTPLSLTDGTIYWISIQAVDNGGSPVQWGWQESIDHWNDNAVQTFPSNPFSWDLQPGEDMAFELRTVPVPTSILLLASGLLGFIGLRRKSGRA